MYAYFFTLMIAIITGTSVLSSVKIIRQGDQALVELLGKYDGKKLEPGLTFLIPFIEQVAYKKTLREQILYLPPKECVTRDKMAIRVDVVVYWRMIDLEKACYKVENLREAMLNLLLTQIRTEVAKLDLEEMFTARDKINEVMVQELDIATEPWGVKVTRVELRDFTIVSKLPYPVKNHNHNHNMNINSSANHYQEISTPPQDIGLINY